MQVWQAFRQGCCGQPWLCLCLLYHQSYHGNLFSGCGYFACNFLYEDSLYADILEFFLYFTSDYNCFPFSAKKTTCRTVSKKKTKEFVGTGSCQIEQLYYCGCLGNQLETPGVTKNECNFLLKQWMQPHCVKLGQYRTGTQHQEK